MLVALLDCNFHIVKYTIFHIILANCATQPSGWVQLYKSCLQLQRFSPFSEIVSETLSVLMSSILVFIWLMEF